MSRPDQSEPMGVECYIRMVEAERDRYREALEAIYVLPNARSRGQDVNRVSVIVSMQEARDIARAALDEERS